MGTKYGACFKYCTIFPQTCELIDHIYQVAGYLENASEKVSEYIIGQNMTPQEEEVLLEKVDEEVICFSDFG